MTMQVVGSGSQSVYVYYYPQYRLHTEAYYWPCKIGMSKHSAVTRIQNQVKTAMPETPEIGLIIHCENAYALEQSLHWILRFKDRQVDAPGQEWFNTTPDEVLLLAQMLNAY